MALENRWVASGGMVARRITRGIYLALGLLFLGIALVGVFLPGVPTTITTIVAGYFFARSSERFDRWLTQHRVLGPIIRDWRDGRGFTRRMKTTAMVAISLSIGLSAYLIESPWVRVALAGSWIWATWLILKQPTKPSAVGR